MLNEITRIKKQYQKINKELTKPKPASDRHRVAALARELRRLSEIIALHKQGQKMHKEIKSTQELLADPELKQEAEKELGNLNRKAEKIKKELAEKMKPTNPDNRKNIIMEIRAGAGGEEAALFAADLFRMYSKYAERQGWQVMILTSNRTGIGGFKEIILEINGRDVYRQLKYESGVHRVQRIPETEKSGRIHTSTASVAVLPQAEDVEIKIKPEEIRIDVFRSSGPGGQSVNTTDSAVRVTHLPTGIVVSCQDQKSQLKNRERAIKILKTRLLDQKREAESSARDQKRRTQIGTAARAEKIRTYNFPQDRITDHRIKKSWFGMEKIMNGDLDELIDTVRAKIK